MSRLSYDVKESDLEREFGRFGPIERVCGLSSSSCARYAHICQIRIVKDTHSKNPKKPHKGYAFVVYEREKDMKGIYTPPSHPCLSVCLGPRVSDCSPGRYLPKYYQY